MNDLKRKTSKEEQRQQSQTNSLLQVVDWPIREAQNQPPLKDKSEFDIAHINWEITPLVYKRQAFKPGQYLDKFDTFESIEMYTFFVLRVRKNEDIIEHFKKHPEGPIIRWTIDKRVWFDYHTNIIESLNEAEASGKFLLYPLRLKVRRLTNVSSDTIAEWEQEKRTNFDDDEEEDDWYFDEEQEISVPIVTESLGPIVKSRETCIRDMLDATGDLQNLHEYVSHNRDLYKVVRGPTKTLQEEPKLRDGDDVFDVRICGRFWCGVCSKFMRLSTPGDFYLGEKLTDISIPQDRYELKYLNEMLELLQLVTATSMTLASLSDASSMTNTLMMKKGKE